MLGIPVQHASNLIVRFHVTNQGQLVSYNTAYRFFEDAANSKETIRSQPFEVYPSSWTNSMQDKLFLQPFYMLHHACWYYAKDKNITAELFESHNCAPAEGATVAEAGKERIVDGDAKDDVSLPVKSAQSTSKAIEVDDRSCISDDERDIPQTTTQDMLRFFLGNDAENEPIIRSMCLTRVFKLLSCAINCTVRRAAGVLEKFHRQFSGRRVSRHTADIFVATTAAGAAASSQVPSRINAQMKQLSFTPWTDELPQHYLIVYQACMAFLCKQEMKESVANGETFYNRRNQTIQTALVCADRGLAGMDETDLCKSTSWGDLDAFFGFIAGSGRCLNHGALHLQSVIAGVNILNVVISAIAVAVGTDYLRAQSLERRFHRQHSGQLVTFDDAHDYVSKAAAAWKNDVLLLKEREVGRPWDVEYPQRLLMLFSACRRYTNSNKKRKEPRAADTKASNPQTPNHSPTIGTASHSSPKTKTYTKPNQDFHNKSIDIDSLLKEHDIWDLKDWELVQLHEKANEGFGEQRLVSEAWKLKRQRKKGNAKEDWGGEWGLGPPL
ncbi:hypothetical protein EJ08DRAFT_46734 [Tothia fuscella]|uniref:Uncharacterized protein n=1 Tax=Tothia fuscella TaxID=1048955 RepID=A0A9P4TS55_9PEZI|nr:hypothetical protein EJ08DRAFT_46734 [Tothia fuscella]